MTDFEQIAMWVLKHRREKAFEAHGFLDLIEEFKAAALNHTMAVDFDQDGRILGVIVGEKQEDTKQFHIRNLLTIHRNSLKNFVRLFQRLYPNYSLTGNRKHKGLVNYSNRHLNKLSYDSTSFSA